MIPHMFWEISTPHKIEGQPPAQKRGSIVGLLPLALWPVGPRDTSTETYGQQRTGSNVT